MFIRGLGRGDSTAGPGNGALGAAGSGIWLKLGTDTGGTEGRGICVGGGIE